MGELLIMRHGKSDWEGGVADHDRRLAPRGVRAARNVGRFLAAAEAAPDLVIASSAERARATAEELLGDGGFACPLRVEPALYEATAAGVLDVVRGVEAPIGRLLVVGHEPWCSELVALLAGGGAVAFPTAAVACLDAGDRPWAALEPGGAVLRWLLPPRLLP